MRPARFFRCPSSTATCRLPCLAIPSFLAVAAVAVLVAGCGGGGGSATASGGRLNVVAAEDFWGSVAEQLGGEKVEVTSIITNPAADPHDYEPSSDDAKTFAGAEMSIVNGIGYDEWASKLLEANPGDRTELDVGDLVGLESGDNPHQWYSPKTVLRVARQIAADYELARPDDDFYFDQQLKRFEVDGLAGYEAAIDSIKRKYGGTRVGASESIFEPLASAVGLKLVTPKGFMDAIAEGTEPTPTEKATADRQLADHEVELWVYNSQNATPDVKRLNEAAEAAGIPIATVTETTTPEGASFQQWMVPELNRIEAALAEGVGGG